MKKESIVIALVGMAGSGKTESAAYLKNKNVPVIRFGDLTDEFVKEAGLPLTPENERMVREGIRKELGMAAYAIKAEPKIRGLLQENEIVVLDGLYSWEEYLFLKEKLPSLLLVHVLTSPLHRYERLSRRAIRPFTKEEARKRDRDEIEKLNKGGPIAYADMVIENNGSVRDLHLQLDRLIDRITGKDK